MKLRWKIVLGLIGLVVLAYVARCTLVFVAVDAYFSNRATNEVYVALNGFQIGRNTVQFYVDYTYDCGVLGFSTKDETGKLRYCPMYGSTYRGMPLMKLDVFVSDTGDQMWVQSSGTAEIMGYYRAGSDRATVSYDLPTPSSFGRDASRFPQMDPAHAKLAKTIIYDEKVAERLYDRKKARQEIDLSDK